MKRGDLEKRSALADALVSATAARAGITSTVVAVGGYGRRELFPFSDVDLLLLAETAPPAEAERKATGDFIRDLWDAGLRASQSVHTAAECCQVQEGNLELTISLLDSRFVTGDRARYEAFEKRFGKFLAGERASVIRHLCAMTRGRHQRHGGTIYILEPNIKEHPGGLRDLHTLRWMQRLGVRVEEKLETEEEFLFSVRLFLHQRYGRDNNLLSFEAQEAIAADPAAWMRKYYRNARAVFRAAVRALRQAEEEGTGLLSQFRERRGRLSNADFTVVRERVLLREPGLFQSDPAAMFRLLEFVARHGLALAPDTERRLSEALPSLDGVGSWWKPLHAVLASPGAATAFRALHEAGLMPALLPEWKRIDALVARDFYHRYTVDEHTIVALESLAALSGSDDPARRRFANLMSEAGDLSALRLALLLHDIGKGGGTGEHAAESARIAEAALRRMDAPGEVSGAALFLIERHLDLSAVIDSRDLDDPATARFAATRTGSIERLRLLTLMTYADISAVNPTAMTPWRLDQLWRLYLVAHEEFTRELQSERIGPRETGPETAAFLEGFPTRYARTHSTDEILQHAALAAEVPWRGAAADIAREAGYFRAVVVSRDHPGLLAALSGAISSFGLAISKAEAFSNSAGVGLNIFAFSDPHRTLELNPTEVERLREMLVSAATGAVDVEKLLEIRPRAKPFRTDSMEPSVRFNDEASDTATLIEIAAADRPGLLHALASALSAFGLNIEVVLINTEAGKAYDVFYVTRNGAKLAPAAEDELRAALLRASAG